jgi:hypothetical protein
MQGNDKNNQSKITLSHFNLIFQILIKKVTWKLIKLKLTLKKISQWVSFQMENFKQVRSFRKKMENKFKKIRKSFIHKAQRVKEMLIWISLKTLMSHFSSIYPWTQAMILD